MAAVVALAAADVALVAAAVALAAALVADVAAAVAEAAAEVGPLKGRRHRHAAQQGCQQGCRLHGKTSEQIQGYSCRQGWAEYYQ